MWLFLQFGYFHQITLLISFYHVFTHSYIYILNAKVYYIKHFKSTKMIASMPMAYIWGVNCLQAVRPDLQFHLFPQTDTFPCWFIVCNILTWVKEVSLRVWGPLSIMLWRGSRVANMPRTLRSPKYSLEEQYYLFKYSETAQLKQINCLFPVTCPTKLG